MALRVLSAGILRYQAGGRPTTRGYLGFVGVLVLSFLGELSSVLPFSFRQADNRVATGDFGLPGLSVDPLFQFTLDSGIIVMAFPSASGRRTLQSA